MELEKAKLLYQKQDSSQKHEREMKDSDQRHEKRMIKTKLYAILARYSLPMVVYCFAPLYGVALLIFTWTGATRQTITEMSEKRHKESMAGIQLSALKLKQEEDKRRALQSIM